ncbi:MAG TPA: hypothetical protein VGR90_00545, partial [Acidimicrobiales bacterium]|nr:hypothetical protein [Acidimicrobiales bacterium]
VKVGTRKTSSYNWIVPGVANMGGERALRCATVLEPTGLRRLNPSNEDPVVLGDRQVGHEDPNLGDQGDKLVRFSRGHRHNRRRSFGGHLSGSSVEGPQRLVRGGVPPLPLLDGIGQMWLVKVPSPSAPDHSDRSVSRTVEGPLPREQFLPPDELVVGDSGAHLFPRLSHPSRIVRIALNP